jgi:hypothetical protein
MEKEMPANPGSAILLRIYGRECGEDNEKSKTRGNQNGGNKKGGQIARLEFVTP